MRANTSSPFYSRNYGGLSGDQITFLEPHLSRVAGPLLDPMSGQAHYLSRLAASGHDVQLADLNPGPLMLATLRDPRILREADALTDWLLAAVKSLGPVRLDDKPVYCDDWIPASSRKQLLEYSAHLGLDQMGNPSTSPRFWKSSLRKRFAAAIPVLAAREIACYTASDNLTWLKKGGLQTNFDVYSAIVRALEEWRRVCHLKTAVKAGGHLIINCTSAEEISPLDSDPPSLIVTSPPYANRLDYTRLWAPELELVAAMFNFDSKTIKDRQIGTTVVRGTAVSQTDIELLPDEIQEALERIRSDELYASATYYYPFFLNYAVAMARTFSALGRILARRGRIVVFVRDTARKDVLFPVGRLVESSLHAGGVRMMVEKRDVIVRSHVGLRRREAQSGVHGLAQREWWVVLRKS